MSVFLHILTFQNILSIYNFFPIKNYIFLADEGSPPPPLKVMSAIKYVIFWTAPLRGWFEEKRIFSDGKEEKHLQTFKTDK